MNRLTKTTYADNSFTQTGYAAAGQVLTSQDANGNVTSYGYDDAGRRTTLTDALTHVTQFGYDAAGNETSVQDANHNTTTYVYDALNRRTQVTYPDSKFELTGYDALGRVNSRTDANGKVTAYGYDSLGRLTSVTQDATSSSNPGGLNLVTQYSYDEVGDRLTQTDANTHTAQYAYDQRGRRAGRTLPLGQAESYLYDANGNLSSRTDFNGRTTTYAYDTLNRLLSKAADPYFVTNHIGAASESFTYTATGKRATMTDQSGTTTYGYDNRDRLQTKATPEGTLSYSYDAASDVKTIQSSNPGGASMAYGYDALDRLSTVTDANGASSYTYDPVGNLGTVAYPNGVAHSYTYDTRNRLTGLNVAPGPSSPALFSYAYALDAAGHRTSVTEQSGRKVNYSYDTIYRLTNETIASDPNGMNGAVSYTYDNVGNRLQKTSTLPGFPGASSTYNANDELTTDQYDADGNTIGSGSNTGTSGYVYDFENRLVQQGGISIVYDGDGNRVSKTTANGMTQYLVDAENPTGYAQVMDEVQSSAIVRTYTWGLDLVSEHQTLNSTLTTSYYVFDGHGSVRALTNASGAITDTYDYDAFGILTHSSGTTPNNYLFAGEQFDPDLNLYYNRARYLNTSTDRFWSRDTHEGDDEDPPSLHAYLYASADAANMLDQSGHDDIAEVTTASAGDITLSGMDALNAWALEQKFNQYRRIATTVLALSGIAVAYFNPTRNSAGVYYDFNLADLTAGDYPNVMVGFEFGGQGGQGYQQIRIGYDYVDPSTHAVRRYRLRFTHTPNGWGASGGMNYNIFKEQLPFTQVALNLNFRFTSNLEFTMQFELQMGFTGLGATIDPQSILRDQVPDSGAGASSPGTVGFVLRSQALIWNLLTGETALGTTAGI